MCCLWCQRYKFWKQFTTGTFPEYDCCRLFMMSKIQILKAIHNRRRCYFQLAIAVYDVKDTNFESNSQQICPKTSVTIAVYDVKDTNFESNSQLLDYANLFASSCLWCQRYKFWKQFTTSVFWFFLIFRCLWCQRYKFWKQFTTIERFLFTVISLFMMSKIQILKAIHNSFSIFRLSWKLFMMSKIQILKAIHNIGDNYPIKRPAVYDVKDTNFESNSQLFFPQLIQGLRCLWCQRYKFWKQFTTTLTVVSTPFALFMMSKIQILKAIHNGAFDSPLIPAAVYDVKDTNFESNSQHSIYLRLCRICCLWCQRYKFWKQFTTSGLLASDVLTLFMMSKIQILKAIHNRDYFITYQSTAVYDVKDTNFESNSQLFFGI